MTLNENTARAMDGPDNYLIAGDPKDAATWLFRIRNGAGELDYRLLERARAKLARGFKRGIFEGAFVAAAFKKLRSLFDSPETLHTIKNENENRTGRGAPVVELPCSH